MLISLFITSCGVLLSYFISQSDIRASAIGDMLVRLMDQLFYGMSALSLVFLILTFLPQAFPAWKKFAIWFIPIATLIFVFYPNPGSGDYFSPYPEQIFQWVSALYVAISVLLILVQVTKKK